jgi:hypothetical protein
LVFIRIAGGRRFTAKSFAALLARYGAAVAVPPQNRTGEMCVVAVFTHHPVSPNRRKGTNYNLFPLLDLSEDIRTIRVIRVLLRLICDCL